MDSPDESPLTIFQYLDTNKNGRISLTEFSNKRGRKLVELVMKRNDPSKKISKTFLKQAFKSLAKNVKNLAIYVANLILVKKVLEFI